MDLTREQLATIIGDVRRKSDDWITEQMRLEDVMEKYGKMFDGIDDDLQLAKNQIKKRKEILEKLNKELEKMRK